jgi:hypothetical protein
MTNKTNAEIWTLDKIVTRVRKDLDLEAETFYRQELMVEAVNSAITDCEELVIDEYSDYLLTYQDYDIEAGDYSLAIPDDIYQMRLRWLHFKRGGFQRRTTDYNDESYKIRKMPFEDVEVQGVRDQYRYRIINSMDIDPHLEIFPQIRGEDAGTQKIRLWYIRHFKRLYNLEDITDVPVPEYLLSHLRVSIMQKEGNPMLDLELAKLKDQKLRLQKTLKFLSDDEEDTLLLPNFNTLSDFGETYYDVGG